MKEKLTPQEERLFKYIEKYNGKCTVKDMIKHMKWNGKYTVSVLSHALKVLIDKGYISTKVVQYLEITLV